MSTFMISLYQVTLVDQSTLTDLSLLVMLRPDSLVGRYGPELDVSPEFGSGDTSPTEKGSGLQIN